MAFTALTSRAVPHNGSRKTHIRHSAIPHTATSVLTAKEYFFTGFFSAVCSLI